jgi:hypothetical protein
MVKAFVRLKNYHEMLFPCFVYNCLVQTATNPYLLLQYCNINNFATSNESRNNKLLKKLLIFFESCNIGKKPASY